MASQCDNEDDCYYAHVDKWSPTNRTSATKFIREEPTAPDADDTKFISKEPTAPEVDDETLASLVAVPVRDPAAVPMTGAIDPPDYIPPTHKAPTSRVKYILKLIPFHLLNLALGVAGFSLVVSGLSLAGSLLPLCCVGVVVYWGLLHAVRFVAMLDVALANLITPSNARAKWDVPDDIADGAAQAYGLRLAPDMVRLSVRSTVVVLYFGTLKFGVGILSGCAVFLPIQPLIFEIESHYITHGESEYAPWNLATFNLGTHPFLYILVWCGYILVGVLLMHPVAVASRWLTRKVCCQEASSVHARAIV